MAVLIFSSCDREDSAINSRGLEDRFLGAIELTDGKTWHWGEQTLALQKLKAVRISYSIGESSVGVADLWCSPADYDKAHALLEPLGGSNSSGFHSVGDFAGLTKEELRHRFPPSDPQRTQDAEQGGADQPATAPELKSEGKDKPQPESKVRPQ